MGNLIQIFCTLLVQFECGLTKTERVAKRTVKFPVIRPDVTDAEIIAFIGVLQPCLVGKILSVKLVTEKITAVLTPEMREEKKQREDEEEIMNSHKEQTRNVAQASASPSSPIQMNNAQPAAAEDVASASALRHAVIRTAEGLPEIPEERPVLFTVPGIQDAIFRLDPRPKTTAQIGIAEPLRKPDAPIYSDTPHFQ